MKLTNDQKEMIENYLKHYVLYETLTIELVNKTIHDLYNLLRIPGMQIFYNPYFGKIPEGVFSTSAPNCIFTLLIALPDGENPFGTTYLVAISPVSELPVAKIKEQ